MGSFSFIFADKPSAKHTDRRYANMVPGDLTRILIPAEFGGGYIDATYEDYGLFRAENGEEFDVYELIAVWNPDAECRGVQIGKFLIGLENVSKANGQKVCDRNTDNNRHYGIEVGCYDYQIDKLKYPLKIVHQDNNETYERCKYISYGDPEQGFYHYSYSTYYRKRKNAS